MRESYHYTVQGMLPNGEERAATVLDLDAMMNLTAEGATHAYQAKQQVLEANVQRAFLSAGWTEGATQASALSEVLAGEVPAVGSIRRRWEWGQEGEELDADRALAGDWDMAYRRKVRQHRPGQVLITLAAQFGGRGNRTAAELFWSGAQLVAATDVLEAAGYKVEAHAINLCRYGNYGYDTTVGALDLLAKRSEDALRPDILMAAVANDKVYRGFGFLAKCWFPSHYGISGMGSTLDHNAAHARDVLSQFSNLGLLPQIDNFMPHAYDRATAVRNVLAVINTVTQGMPSHV